MISRLSRSSALWGTYTPREYNRLENFQISSVLVPLDAGRQWLLKELNQIKGYVSLDEAVGE